MKQNRHINKVAVIGSGIMGSRIACHFANIGVNVLLLDIIPSNLSEDQKKDNEIRNSIVNNALRITLKSKPSPIYSKAFISRITTGNLEDDLYKISEVDWIIEAVIERLDIKKQVFKKIEKHRKEGTLISSNTSGIPIENMLDGRSEDFQKQRIIETYPENYGIHLDRTNNISESYINELHGHYSFNMNKHNENYIYNFIENVFTY